MVADFIKIAMPRQIRVRYPGAIYHVTSWGDRTRERIRQNWCFGSEEFTAELVAGTEGQIGGHHSGALHLETSRFRAEPIVAEELGRLGSTEQDLATRRKDASEKPGHRHACATMLRTSSGG